MKSGLRIFATNCNIIYGVRFFNVSFIPYYTVKQQVHKA